MAIEWERKFELDVSAPVPDLTGTGLVAGRTEPVQQRLDATYFDTRDLRLAKAGVTLRRRTGGTDAGWHLKIPLSLERREEIGLPLGEDRDTVPVELARLVTARSHGDELVPIAHIATTRDSAELLDAEGRTLAAVADDQVAAETIGQAPRLERWRELEVELAEDAGAAVLDEVTETLRHQGVRRATGPSKLSRILGDRLPAEDADAEPGTTAGEVVLGYLRRQAELLRAHDVGVRRGAEDAVHQMRVAGRRLRSALSTFRRLLDRDATRDLADELKWLSGRLAAARDTEVLAARLAEQLDEQPTELVLGPVKAALTAHFARQEREARDTALEALDSTRYVELLRGLDQLLTDPPLTHRAGRPADAELRHALRRADRRLRRTVKALDGIEDRSQLNEALHEVRKKAKQARYCADAAEPAFGARLKSWRNGVKKVQSALGNQHDCVVAADALRELGVQAGLAGANAFTYGLLHRHNTAEAEHWQAVFHRRWNELDDRRTPGWLG
ncbi:CYTH and CHAD domain-containing protein [Amycolatopsis nigrescens]|uniref:CYTH and CHAD domain-containing protein n=1 Tax=Amycolatopsis nigrescens TaxID=381445 RepID=UPI000364AEE2|nr:CYTH and CHAD domain-containing protein [Amycolatopsis nigrescens]